MINFAVSAATEFPNMVSTCLESVSLKDWWDLTLQILPPDSRILEVTPLKRHVQVYVAEDYEDCS